MTLADSNGMKSVRPCAFRGLHEHVFTLLRKLVSPPAVIVDIAAGRGAFTRVLLEAGYRVSANDIDTSQWGIASHKPMSIDLNGDFTTVFGEIKPQAIVAIEVIEHLESPRHFLRECYNSIKGDGYMLVSTPNISSALSRAMFLRQGRWPLFTEGDYETSGHITPLPPWLLKTHAQKSGWEIVSETYAGTYPARKLHQKFSLLIARYIGRYSNRDEASCACVVFVLRKVQ